MIPRPDAEGTVVAIGDHSTVPGGHLWRVELDDGRTIWLVDRTIRGRSLDIGDRVRLRWVSAGKYWEATPI